MKPTKHNYRKQLRTLVVCFSLVIFHSTTYGQNRNLFFSSFDSIYQLNLSGASPQLRYFNANDGEYGISHMEDASGNVLFFISYRGIYRYSNGTLMPGSIGMISPGMMSEVGICPNPANASQYFVFYTHKTCKSLFYCIVDMSLAGGQGDVIQANSVIDSYYYSGGLEIVKVPCQDKYWLIVNECGKGLTRFTIDQSGISGRQLIYNYVPHMPPATPYLGIGEIEYHQGRFGICFTGAAIALLGNFNPQTGQLYNIFELNYNIDFSQPSSGFYGLEFSPDGSKAYFTCYVETLQDNLYQYDFTTGILQGFFLPAAGPGSPGQIETGWDGKLYVAEAYHDQIDVISNANSLTPAFSTITASTGSYGISDRIESPTWNSNNFYFSNTCSDDSVHFTCITNPCMGLVASTWLWNFGDPTSGSTNTSTLQNPVHQYSAPGTYSVTLTCNAGTAYTQTLTNIVTIGERHSFSLGNDTTICHGHQIVCEGPVLPGVHYLWSNGDTTRSLSVGTAGSFILTINDGACLSRDTIHVSLMNNVIANLGENVYICNGGSVNLSTSVINTNWSTGASNTYYITVNSPGTYWAESNSLGCITRDTIQVLQADSLVHALGNDTSLCPGNYMHLSLHIPNATILLDNQFSVNVDLNWPVYQGTHTVEIHLPSCIIRDTITVIKLAHPTLDLGPDILNCEDHPPVMLTAPLIPTGTFAWSTGETGHAFVDHTSTVTGTWNTGCGVISDFVQVVFYEYPKSLLPEEIFACVPVDVAIDAGASYYGYVWSTSEYTHQIQANHLGTYSVILNNHNCISYDTVTIKPYVFEDYEQFTNIITPNDDQVNDYLFYEKYKDCTFFQIEIFDRWGKQVASSSDPLFCWDGKTQPDGTYYYILQYQDPCEQEEILKKTGFLQVIR